MSLSRSDIYRNLATLLESGVPVEKSFRSAGMGEDSRLARALGEIADAVAAGKDVSGAMEKRPRLFPPFDRMLVSVGEQSGRLPECLESLADWYAFTTRLRRTLLSGLSYPFLVLHFAALIIPLPALVLEGDVSLYFRRVVATISMFYVPAAILLGIYFIGSVENPLRIMVDVFSIHIPLLGKGLVDLALSRYAGTFHAMYEAGIPMDECARVSARLCGNSAVRQWVEGGFRSARRGEMISEGFSPAVPNDFHAIWQVAEESGTLGPGLKRLAKTRAESAERRLEEIIRWTPRIAYFLLVFYLAYVIITGFLNVYSQIFRMADF
ncbi:MAG: type II secretion system F family protein [Planctomycetota bacterium]